MPQIHAAPIRGAWEYIDVEPEGDGGLRIVRQLLFDAGGESETSWILTADQARQVRAMLGYGADEELTPIGGSSFGALLVEAIGRLDPPASRHAWWDPD